MCWLLCYNNVITITSTDVIVSLIPAVKLKTEDVNKASSVSADVDGGRTIDGGGIGSSGPGAAGALLQCSPRQPEMLKVIR